MRASTNSGEGRHKLQTKGGPSRQKKFEQQIIKHLAAKSRLHQPVELVDIISKMFTEGKIVFDARDPNKPPLSYFRDDDEFFPAEVFGWHAELQKLTRLIHHLKDNDLIRLLNLPEKRLAYSPLNPQVDQATLIYYRLRKERHYIEFSKEDTDTLIECLNSLVYVNPALIDLVDKDLRFTEG